MPYRLLWADGAAMTQADAVHLALGDGAEDGVRGRAAAEPATARPAQGAPAGALTAREREVVALLAAGLSNRAIASELYITPATAARHVANILAKLDFSSRSQVAAWARAGANGGQVTPNSALTDSPS